MEKHSTKSLAGLLTASFILAAGTPVFAAANISMEARYFSPDLTFTAQTDSIDYNGGSVDFKNDLGITDKKAPEYRIQLGNNLRLDYTKLNYNGSTTLAQELNYNGARYTTTTDVDSQLGIDYGRLTLLFPLTKSERLQTKLLVDIKGFKFDTVVTGVNADSGLVETKTEDFAGAVPSIGFAGNLKLDKAGKIQGFAEISGIPLGKYGNFYDAEAGLKCKVAKDTSVNIGYRVFDLDVKDPDNNDQVRFKLAGMFYGLDHKF